MSDINEETHEAVHPPPPKFVPKPGTKSPVWSYGFGLKKDSEGQLIDDSRAYCNICIVAVYLQCIKLDVSFEKTTISQSTDNSKLLSLN